MVLLFLFLAAREPAKAEDPRALADKYLLALSDSHDQTGKNFLFGGLTLDAVTATAMQPEITGQGGKRTEDGTIEDALKALASVDAAGAQTASLEEAKRLMEKTKAERKELSKKNPVLADTIRADRPLYWHPANPARKWLEGKSGAYHLEYVAFTVKSKDSDGKAKTWPLRLVRLKAGDSDTGWKILPASTWDPE